MTLPWIVGALVVSAPALAYDVAPPEKHPSANYAILQAAIEEHPNEVLVLQPGIYDIGKHWLDVRHGVTVEGATDAEGNLLTTVTGGDNLFYVTLFGEHAYDDVTLHDLKLLGYGPWEAIVHTPLDTASYTWQPGGGNLTVEGCEIEVAAWNVIWSLWVDGVSIRVRDNRMKTRSDDYGGEALFIQNSSYTFLEVVGNEIDSGAAGVEIFNNIQRWQPYQDASAGPARILDNDIVCHSGGCVEGIRLVGSALVSGNTLRPAVDEDDAFTSGLFWSSGPSPTSAAQVVGNTFVGGDGSDVQWLGGIRLGGLGRAEALQVKENAFWGDWNYGVLAQGESKGNIFIANDFAEASFAGPTWVFEADTENNSVTDSSGVTQTVIDFGVRNHFQGTSPFLPFD